MDRGKGRVIQKRNSLQLDFMYKGERFRPTLVGLSADKKAHWKTAEDKLAQVKAEIISGKFNPYLHFPEYPKSKRFRKGSNLKIRELLDRWLEGRRKIVEMTTFKTDKSCIDHHLIPYFGDLALAELTTSNVKDWMQEVHIENKTVNNALAPLRAIYREAFEDGLIDINPMARIRNLPNRTEEVDPFSIEQVGEILSACEGQFRNLIKFAFYTGLRTSELIGLKWDNVNLIEKKAYIRNVVTKQGEKNRPKTSGSIRNVALLPPALEALEAQLPYKDKSDYVFHNPVTGGRWSGPERIKRYWVKALKQAGIPYRKPYTTRHTFASMMLSAGVHPMHVAAQLGHNDWGMIRKIYGKYIKDADTFQMDKISHLWAPISQPVQQVIDVPMNQLRSNPVTPTNIIYMFL